ncbi:MAG TPA: hypothetical protein PKD61_24225 [Polyangiaceae bacterium]|nr:hypothetical protein [Polyangiaceae bacterium]
MRIATHVFVLSFAIATSAIASPSSPTTAERERARQLFEQSKPLQDAGNCVQAVRLLTEAFALHESPDIAANLGSCEASLGKYADAAEHLRFANERMMPSAEPAQREKLQTAFDIVKKQVAELVLELSPSDSAVSLNGKATLVRDGVVFLKPGKHTITVSAPDHLAKTLEVEVQKGQRRVETIALDKDPATAAAAGAAGSPGVGGGVANGGANGEAGTPSGLSTRNTVAIVGGALTAVAVGAGVFFAVRASSAQDDVDTFKATAVRQLGGNCPRGSSAPVCLDLADAADQRNTANQNATIAFVAGGVLGAATITTYLLWPTSDKKNGRAPTRVVPVVSASGVALGLQGSFF